MKRAAFGCLAGTRTHVIAVGAVCVLLCLTALASAATFTEDTLIDVGDSTYDFEDIVVQGCTVTINGQHEFNNLAVIDNGIVTHAAFVATAPGGVPLELMIAGEMTVEANSRIDVSAKGWPGGSGEPRVGRGSMSPDSGGGGAGHGGFGGAGQDGEPSSSLGGVVYGSFVLPTMAGCGGGNSVDHESIGGSGGGIIRLTVAGTLTVDGGIHADGGDTEGAWGGAGAGGSIWLQAGTLAGSGSITANGGSTEFGGGGAGGRIAAYYAGNSFTGTMAAVGGAGYNSGGPGTIYSRASGEQHPRLVIDNAGNSGATFLNGSVVSNGMPDLTASGGAVVQFSAYNPVHVYSLQVLTGAAVTPYLGSLEIEVETDVTVDATSSIVADGKGDGPGAGPQPGMHDPAHGGGGGGYGGVGGTGQAGLAIGGGTYGAFSGPMQPGSGGGNGYESTGGSGGSQISLGVGGTLTLDGIVSANGTGGTGPWAGGGAGGGIWIRGRTFAGSGSITANGGSTTYGGGGAGGRIAIEHETSSFTGTISAFGGTGHGNGGAGTVYSKGCSEDRPRLVIDNAGHDGKTLLTGAEVTNARPDLTASGGAVVEFNGGDLVNVYSLQVLSGAAIAQGDQELCIIVEMDATIDATASVVADGKGYGPGGGLQPGMSDVSYAGGGGGHGGIGGTGQFGALGGKVYGSVTQPSDNGSGGGNGCESTGGGGGGRIFLDVLNTLTLDGVVSANGTGGTGLWAGGGSAGCIGIRTKTLAGSGSITANGGSTTYGGGGAGGRIAIEHETSSFTGTISAFGGTGHGNGGAGTVYSKGCSEDRPRLVIDNAGQAGLTQLDSSGLTDRPEVIIAAGTGY